MLTGFTTAGVTTCELTLANSAVQYRSGAKTAHAATAAMIS